MGELLFGKSDLSAVRPVREYLTELINVNDGRGGADGILSVEVFHEPDLCSGAYLLHRIASKKWFAVAHSFSIILQQAHNVNRLNDDFGKYDGGIQSKPP